MLIALEEHRQSPITHKRTLVRKQLLRLPSNENLTLLALQLYTVAQEERVPMQKVLFTDMKVEFSNELFLSLGSSIRSIEAIARAQLYPYNWLTNFSNLTTDVDECYRAAVP